MKKIPSFTIDHTRLVAGLYVSRRDVTPSGDQLTTFDVRFTAPNREEPLEPETMHTLEHLVATFLRNDAEWSSRVVYWGPMGCCTGFYLIMQGELEPADVAPLLLEAMRWSASHPGPIPGATPRDCGNYSFMDLPGARVAARRYAERVLGKLSPACTVYPE